MCVALSQKALGVQATSFGHALIPKYNWISQCVIWGTSGKCCLKWSKIFKREVPHICSFASFWGADLFFMQEYSKWENQKVWGAYMLVHLYSSFIFTLLSSHFHLLSVSYLTNACKWLRFFFFFFLTVTYLLISFTTELLLCMLWIWLMKRYGGGYKGWHISMLPTLKIYDIEDFPLHLSLCLLSPRFITPCLL